MADGFTDRFSTPDRRFGRVLLTFMALAFVALIAAAATIGWNTLRNQDYTAEVVHTLDVRQAIADVQVQLEQSETARRGYVLSGKPLFRTAFARTDGAIRPGLAQLTRLTADNPRQTARLSSIAVQFARLERLRAQSMALADAGALDVARRRFADDASVPTMRAIRYRLEAMASEEASLLVTRAERQRATTRLFFASLAVAAVLLGVVALLSLLVVFRNHRDLTGSRDALASLNDTLEDQVAERTADLSRANEEIQRFAYIVSHDLRSPLVNVMGFTSELAAAADPLAALVDRVEAERPDLLSDDARLAAREDLPEAIGFIRTSTQKMDRLINAILRLSREGRRIITPERIDPAALVDTIAGSIQHLLDARGVTLVVERPMPMLVTDRLALEQILSNLVENASKYLQPGRPGTITVSAREQRGRVIVAVADNGRGIDPRDHQRVFDLFRRSGAQDQPGEGIGLAHVRALAYRLGGTIDVESELGQGATFRLNLPAAYDQQDSKP